jgi:signal transduction histidine kinase
MTCPVLPPATICDNHTALILTALRDYIGIHEPIFNDNDEIVDTQLVWWNEPYEAIRIEQPLVGQTITDKYIEPDIAIDYVRRAWHENSVRQVFELSEDTVDMYRPPEVLVRIEVTWLRIGELVVEIGSDLSEMTALELELIAQRQAYTDATREALLSLERARIGRDLHDSIIQNLFAIALRLQSQNSEPWAVNAIHEVINEIRDTIFNIEPETRQPVRSRIEKVIEMFSGAWTSPIEQNISVARELPDDLIDDVENVLREGLSNSARHAKATQVWVTLNITDNFVSLHIRDNGVGPHGLKRRKAGTLSMAHRAKSHHGSFALVAAEEGGSLLTWECPIN